MSNTDLYIIAAGRGSRLGGTIPKALVRMLDEPCLTLNLRRIGLKFRRIFVVTNLLAEDHWELYFESLLESDPNLAKLTVHLPIVSGLGDGHATLEGLTSAERRFGEDLSNEVVIAWGDVVFTSGDLIDEMMAIELRGSGLLPVTREGKPYVSLLVDASMRCIAANFSKYGESALSTFHDQSVFRFDRRQLFCSLQLLHRALWKNDRYIAPSGELSLLYSFHYLYNASAPVYIYETNYPTLSYNTVEEFQAVERSARLA